MSDSKKLLAELRQKVEEAKRKLEEQENALRIVESMLDVPEEKDISKADSLTADAKAKKSMGKRRVRIGAAPTGTIIDNVTAILPCFNEATYTASDVYAHMLEAGTAPDNKGAISTSLRKLAIRKKIEVAVQGKGKAPSLYKNKEEVNFM